MTRKELIEYCRYYKGEEECPSKEGNVLTSDVPLHTRGIAYQIIINRQSYGYRTFAENSETL